MRSPLNQHISSCNNSYLFFVDVQNDVGSFNQVIYFRHLDCCKCQDCAMMHKLKASYTRVHPIPAMQEDSIPPMEMYRKIFDVTVLQDDLECNLCQFQIPFKYKLKDSSSICDSLPCQHHQKDILRTFKRQSSISEQHSLKSMNLSVSPIDSLTPLTVQSLHASFDCTSFHQPITETGSSIESTIHYSTPCIEVDVCCDRNDTVIISDSNNVTDINRSATNVSLSLNNTITPSMFGLYNRPTVVQHTDSCISIRMQNYVVDLQNNPPSIDAGSLPVSTINGASFCLYCTCHVQQDGTGGNPGETEYVDNIIQIPCLINEFSSLDCSLKTSLYERAIEQATIEQVSTSLSLSRMEQVFGRNFANVTPESGEDIVCQRPSSFSFLRQISNPEFSNISLNESISAV